jgi:hypothetical protein
MAAPMREVPKFVSLLDMADEWAEETRASSSNMCYPEDLEYENYSQQTNNPHVQMLIVQRPQSHHTLQVLSYSVLAMLTFVLVLSDLPTAYLHIVLMLSPLRFLRYIVMRTVYLARVHEAFAELVLTSVSATSTPMYTDVSNLSEFRCWLEEGYVLAVPEDRTDYANRVRLSRIFRYRVKMAPPQTRFLNSVRSTFAKWHLTFQPLNDDNPHAAGAAVRHEATEIIKRIQRSDEDYWLRYDVQINACNSADDGSSLVFDPVDVASVQRRNLTDLIDDPMLSSQVTWDEAGNMLMNGKIITGLEYRGIMLTMIDVDFHAHMPYWLNLMLPIMTYSFMPTKATEADGMGTSHYFEDNKLNFQSHMGYCCAHPLWNYGPDYCVSTHKGVLTWNRVVTYALPQHRVIHALIPVMQMPEEYDWLGPVARRHNLRRYNVNFKGDDCDWTAFRFWEKGRQVVSVAAAGPDSRCVVLPWETFGEIIDHIRVFGGSRVPEHTVCSLAGDHAGLLCKYVHDYIKYKHVLDTFHRGIDHIDGPPKIDRTAAPHVLCPDCIPPSDRGVNECVHLKYGEHTTVVDRPTVTTVGPSPYLDKVGASTAAVAPIRDYQAALAAYTQRIREPQTKSRQRARPGLVRGLIPAFVQALMSRVPKYDPLTEEQVLDRVKPSVREATKAGFEDPLGAHSKKTRAFIKGESYTVAKAPRIITPLEPSLQARMYRFAYALQDALHELPWFAFGTRLPTLSQRIANLTLDAGAVIETDYSKFDGTISPIAREVELAVYRAYFPTHQSEIEKLMKCEVHQSVSLKGVRYDSGTTRSSGAPDTCLMNSILNMFVLFLTIGPDAFDIAIIGGDDGIISIQKSHNPDKIKEAIDRCSADCGFDIKSKPILRGETFSFLARRFSFGSPNSICQPDRLVPKLNVLGHPNIPVHLREPRLRMKLESVLLSDSNTPVIGALIRRMLAPLASGYVPPQYCQENAWWDDVLTGGPWPNALEPWMEGEVARYLHANGDLVENAVSSIQPIRARALSNPIGLTKTRPRTNSLDFSGVASSTLETQRPKAAAKLTVCATSGGVASSTLATQRPTATAAAPISATNDAKPTKRCTWRTIKHNDVVTTAGSSTLSTQRPNPVRTTLKCSRGDLHVSVQKK